MTAEQIRALKSLEAEYREELAPIVSERVRVHNLSLRTIYVRDGVMEYGPFPPDVQAYLDFLDKQAEVIRWKYEKRASAETQPMGR